MKNSCDCIIPFYNEGQRVINVISSVLKLKKLSQIIVVDDGSESPETYLELKKIFPQVTSIRSEKNIGKPNAVKEGLKHVKSDYVLVMDGDLLDINLNDLENAIEKITNNPQIDMIVLRRVSDNTSLAFIRQDIVTSGQRIFKRQDLEKVFQENDSQYQLEVAVNSYMMKNKKKIYWMPFSFHNIWRHNKWGLAGYKMYLKATLINFRVGFYKLIWQTLFFCRQEAP